MQWIKLHFLVTATGSTCENSLPPLEARTWKRFVQHIAGWKGQKYKILMQHLGNYATNQ